jgi:hypothetical protein
LLHTRKIVDILLDKLYSSEKEFKNTLEEEHSCAKTTETLARFGRSSTNSRGLESSQSAAADKNYFSSITTYQKVCLHGRNKSNQGEES